MAMILAFPGTGAPARPAELVDPAEIVLVPARVSRARWLRREALRIAAGVGGASYVNVWRIIFSERTRAGLPEAIARADADDAVDHVKSMVAALDSWERPPRLSGPDDRGAA
ncbi:MAG: hypothetical protein IOC54_04575 [Methylobacterium sp.]|jgi:hypothetical protein|nr:hypothetical protein [Methylobacterium sp.]MCA3651098.1 hypothetical protein [Methylobacterium sp.]MCA4921536.1 hypothetical protein [Methylobacterium sp.]